MPGASPSRERIFPTVILGTRSAHICDTITAKQTMEKESPQSDFLVSSNASGLRLAWEADIQLAGRIRTIAPARTHPAVAVIQQEGRRILIWWKTVTVSSPPVSAEAWYLAGTGGGLSRFMAFKNVGHFVPCPAAAHDQLGRIQLSTGVAGPAK